jgi:hypothetical protein
VLAQLPDDARFRCQSPYHWAAAYLLCAALVLGLACFRTPTRSASEGIAHGEPR